MNKVRFGVVGVGMMGQILARFIAGAQSNEFSLTAVCDILLDRAKEIGNALNVPFFENAQELYDSGLVDAVIIATPHYWHPPLTIRAARAGLHVLCEKPLAVTIGPAKAAIAECNRNNVVLASMLQHRTRPIMRRIKQMVATGEIGEVFRASLICSNWFRTQAYYENGAWRGTWDGEGGGVLMNQGPHHLDLFTWIVGLPKRIVGLVSTRTHNIEVEDTANFLCDYDDGRIGYICATTAEFPGTEQLVVCGDKATIIAEGHKLRIGRLAYEPRFYTGLKDYTLRGGVKLPDNIKPPDKDKIRVDWTEHDYSADKGGQHIEVIAAFVAHILRGEPLVATGKDFLGGLELANAMYLAGYKNKAVDLPIDDNEIETLIAQLEKERSTGKGGGIRAKANDDLQTLLGSGPTSAGSPPSTGRPVPHTR